MVKGVSPDSVTFICAKIYMKKWKDKGSAEDGCLAVFDRLPVRDVVTWNVLAAGYSQDGLSQAALDYSEQMQVQGINPDAISYLCIFKVCGNLSGEKGTQ